MITNCYRWGFRLYVSRDDWVYITWSMTECSENKKNLIPIVWMNGRNFGQFITDVSREWMSRVWSRGGYSFLDSIVCEVWFASHRCEFLQPPAFASYAHVALNTWKICRSTQSSSVYEATLKFLHEMGGGSSDRAVPHYRFEVISKLQLISKTYVH